MYNSVEVENVKHIKKIIIPFLLIVLVGCGIGGLRYKNNTIKETTPEYEITIEEPYILGTGDVEFEKSINQGFAERSTVWKDDFLLRIPQAASAKSELYVASSAPYIGEDFISLLQNKYVYTGGAHGNTWLISDNIDVKYKKKIMLKDLFFDENYIEFLNLRIDELIQENPEKYSDLWQQPTIGEKQQENFYIDDHNLVIFYQPYDLSYYAKGIIEFPISVESLRGYIKPEYADRL